MTILGLSGLINFLTAFSLGIIVLFKNNQSSINRSCFFLNLSVAFFSLFYFLWQVIPNINLKVIFFQYLTIGIIFIQPTYIQFVYEVLGTVKKNKSKLYFFYLINFVFAILSAKSILFSDYIMKGSLGYWPSPTKIFNIYLFFWFFQCFYGFNHLLKGYYKAKGYKKEQIKYFLLGAIVGFLGGASNWFIWYNIYIPPYPNFLISIYVFILFYSIIKYRLMDIKIAITNITLFFIVYGLVLGIPIYLHFNNQKTFALALMLVLATFGPYFYGFLRKKAEKRLFYDQIMYQKTLMDFSKNTVEIKDLFDLIHSAVDTIYKSIGLTHVLFYLFDKDSKCYDLKYQKSSIDREFLKSFEETSELMKYVKENKTILLTQEVNEDKTIRNLFDRYKIELTIPLIYDKEFLGAIFLGSKENKTLYTDQDIIVLKILANQISLAIENCLYLKELQQKIEEENSHTRRASLDNAVATIAHQLCNPLAIINVNLQLFKIDILPIMHLDNEKRREDVVKMIENSLEVTTRATKIIKDIENFARGGKQLGKVNIQKDVLDPFETMKSIIVKPFHNINYEIKVDKDINDVFAEPVYLQEILYVLVKNAYEAVNKSNNETREVKLIIKNEDDFVNIRIEDSGMGVSKDEKIRTRLYEVPTTTKGSTEGGSGVGLVRVRNICNKIKAEYGFESSGPNKGSSFWIKVPEFKEKNNE